uniref:Outer capsid glycoprotein VP7 n=1 Tax=Rotavirus D TaxID=335100 RepID=A0A067ZW14_9REOV|nr:outer capsid protein [Rotavirus D]
MPSRSLHMHKYLVNSLVCLILILLVRKIIYWLFCVLKSITMDLVIIALLLSFVAPTTYAVNCIDDSLADYQYNTICMFHPDITEPDWQNILNQLLLSKGIPLGSMIYVKYTSIDEIITGNRFYCDYNLVLVDASNYANEQYANLDQVVDMLMFNYDCIDMDVNLYYYSQQRDELWLASGSCEVKVCPLNQQTLGIGCNIADSSTYATLTTANDKFEIIDVIDDINYKINITTSACSIKRCYKQSERTNVAVIQIGGYNVYDISESPVTYRSNHRMMRVSWKKWWAIFYQVVDFINDILTTMVRQTHNNGIYRMVGQ